MILIAPPPSPSFTFLIHSPLPNISRFPPTPWVTLLTYSSLVPTPLPSCLLIRLTLLFLITAPFSSPSLFLLHLNLIVLPRPPVAFALLISLPSQMIFYLLLSIPLLLIPSNPTFSFLTLRFLLFLINMLLSKLSLALCDLTNHTLLPRSFLKNPKDLN